MDCCEKIDVVQEETDVCSNSEAKAEIVDVKEEISYSDLTDLGIISQQLYETQFFGFTPKSFTDGLYNAFVEYVDEGLTSLAKKLKSECKQDVATEQDLCDAASQAYNKVLPDIGAAFDKLEVYAFTNVFRVPDGVLLKEDEPWQQLPPLPTADDVQKLEEDIVLLEEKIKAAKGVQAYLRQELVDTDPLVTRLRQVVEEQKSLLATAHKAYELGGCECIPVAEKE